MERKPQNEKENTMTMMIQNLQPANVLSVYSGKKDRCCCGFAGKHSYASATRTEAQTSRGYAIGDDEVNDKMVTRVLRLIQAHEGDVTIDDETCISVELGNRLYIAYLRAGVAL